MTLLMGDPPAIRAAVRTPPVEYPTHKPAYTDINKLVRGTLCHFTLRSAQTLPGTQLGTYCTTLRLLAMCATLLRCEMRAGPPSCTSFFDLVLVTIGMLSCLCITVAETRDPETSHDSPADHILWSFKDKSLSGAQQDQKFHVLNSTAHTTLTLPAEKWEHNVTCNIDICSGAQQPAALALALVLVLAFECGTISSVPPVQKWPRIEVTFCLFSRALFDSPTLSRCSSAREATGFERAHGAEHVLQCLGLHSARHSLSNARLPSKMPHRATLRRPRPVLHDSVRKSKRSA